MKIRSTVEQATPAPLPQMVDVSMADPSEQYAVLVAMLEANDAANPAPYTRTPPWGEPSEIGEISDVVLEHNYLPAADLQPEVEQSLIEVISDSWGNLIPQVTWYNDQQYHSLGVPPGVPNYGQPIESGHTQITLPNPASEVGWGAWSGRPVLARVARHENDFPDYGAGTSRGHMLSIEKNYSPIINRTQQHRDLLLAELMRRGVHGVVISDVPSVPYNEQVQQIDPLMMPYEAEIGPEGVLP